MRQSSLPEKNFIQHADVKPPAVTPKDDPDETVADVFNTLSEKQKTVVYAMIAHAIEGDDDDDDDGVKHSDEINKGGKDDMKHNVFDQTVDDKKGPVLTHAQFSDILADAQKYGSFRKFLRACGYLWYWKYWLSVPGCQNCYPKSRTHHAGRGMG